MVSYGPDSQPADMTHMYLFTDYRNPKDKHKICTNKGSIFDFIYNAKNFTKFRKIVDKAMMVGQLNSLQADMTVFIPSDNYLQHVPNDFIEYMDDGMARQILAASTLNRRIDKELLTSSPVAYYITRNPSMKMYMTNINDKTVINGNVNVVHFDVPCANGLIHLVDNLIIPSDNTFIN